VKRGFRYLLRLINANAHDCPVLLRTHGHSLRILAADGNPVQSMMGTMIVLFPGTFYSTHIAFSISLSSVSVQSFFIDIYIYIKIVARA